MAFRKGDTAMAGALKDAGIDENYCISVNDALEAEPEKVNQDPYGEGWMVTMKADDPDTVSSLLSAEQYSAGL